MYSKVVELVFGSVASVISKRDAKLVHKPINFETLNNNNKYKKKKNKQLLLIPVSTEL